METLIELLSKVWNNDPKMVDFCAKNSIYLDMGNYYLDVMSIPKIDRDLYYADEDYATGQPAKDPGTGWNHFKWYNMNINSPKKSIEFIEEGHQEVVIMTQYRNDNTGDKLRCWMTKRSYEILPTDRIATQAEKTAILTELKRQLKLYEIRLEKYFKRYGNKIHTHSYWANR